VVAVPAAGAAEAVTVRCLETLVSRWPERFTSAAEAALKARG